MVQTFKRTAKTRAGRAILLLTGLLVVSAFLTWWLLPAPAALTTSQRQRVISAVADQTTGDSIADSVDIIDQVTESTSAWAMTGDTGAAATVGQSVTIQGGVGGTTSGTGGAAQAIGGAGTGSGVGGAGVLTGGAGGATANGGAVNITAGATIAGVGGTGGAVVVAGGANANTTNGAGGAVTFDGGAGKGSGAGGAASVDGGAVTAGAGNGGAANLTGGAASGTSTGDGGAATLAGGASSGGATGDGGAVVVDGGDSTTTTGNGGDITVTAGLSTGAVEGGIVTIVAGAGGAAGAGGTVDVTGGAPASGNAAGGAVTTTGGAGSGTGNGGAVALDGGASGAGATGDGGAAQVTAGSASSTNGAGGINTLRGGNGAGTGAGGALNARGGLGGSGATGNGGAGTFAGGAAQSTNGTGGLASLTGGVGTGTGSGGAITITAGASAGASGTGGAVTIDTGAPAAGTAADITIGGTSAKDIFLTPIFGYLNQEGVPERYRLLWIAGAEGKPGINGDILNATNTIHKIADEHFEVLGTNATTAEVTYYAEGGLTLTTKGDADPTETIILPHLDTTQTAWSSVTWGTDKEVRWDCTITSGVNITNTIIYAGLKLTNTNVTATDADQVFFRYQDSVNSGEWQAVNSIGNSDDAHDTDVAVATSTVYHLTIIIAADRTAKMYINGILEETSAALTDTTDLIPYIGVANSGASAAKVIRVHNQAISRTIN